MRTNSLSNLSLMSLHHFSSLFPSGAILDISKGIASCERGTAAVEVFWPDGLKPRHIRRCLEIVSVIVPRGLVAQAFEQIDLEPHERFLIIERQGAAQYSRIQKQCVASGKGSGIAQADCDSSNRLPHDVSIGVMLLVAIKRHCAQGYRLGSAEKGARCIRRDAKSGIPDANIGLHVEVCVVVSEREREIGIRHQRSPETVCPPMFESIDVADVVAIFANVDCSVDGRPKLRFIGGVDLIALELPRENLRVRPVVIPKLEISADSQ